MTNIERQKSLDKKKWIESKKAGKDQSGAMIYCIYCDKRKKDEYTCSVDQPEREVKCLCAKAYNRMLR